MSSAALWGVSMAGTVTSILQNASGLPMLRRVREEGDAARFTRVPLLTMTVTVLQLGLYGILMYGYPQGLQLVFCNIVGFFTWLLQFLVLLRFTHGARARALFAAQYLLALAWGVALPLGVFLAAPADTPLATRQAVVAVCMQTANLSGFLSPVAALREALRDKDLRRTPGALSWVNVANGALWTAYGVLLGDLWISVPNALGLAIASAQVAVILFITRWRALNPELAAALAAARETREEAERKASTAAAVAAAEDAAGVLAAEAEPTPTMAPAGAGAVAKSSSPHSATHLSLLAALVVLTAAPARAQAPWSCGAGLAQLHVDAASGVYEVRVGAGAAAAAWLDGGDVALHFGGPHGPWLARSAGALAPAAPGAASSGRDAALGAFERLTIEWAATTTPPLLPFSFATAFTCYSEAELLTFTQLYAAGTNGADVSTYDDAARPHDSFDNFNVSWSPTAHFPSFSAGAGSPLAALGYIEWAGEFSWHMSSYGLGLGSNATGNDSGSGYVGGQLGGPVLLHAASAPHTAAVMLGPLANFKDVMLARETGGDLSAGPRLVFGPQGHLASLPAGFAPTLGLAAPSGLATGAVFPLETGVTAAVYSFGAALRALHNTTRPAPEEDVGVSLLSVWTDNGSVYDGDFWSQSGKGGTAGDVFLNLSATLAKQGIPAASFQLDPYWFASGTPGNRNWSASVDVWGADGFERMLAGGVRPTLYSFFWAPASTTTFTQFRWVNGVADTFISGVIGRIAPEDSLAFHAELMRRCRLWSCVGFEVDFLDFLYFAFADALHSPGLHEQYLAGLSAAAVAAGVPVQLCMPLPSDVLATVALPGVSNVRASDDDDLTYAPAFRWKIGLTSMLHGALGVRPFHDVAWTYAAYSGADAADVPYPSGYAQNSTELGIVVSVLSTGPVGFGDKAGFSNSSLLRAACARNGVLLKPSLPAAPLDLLFAVAPGKLPPTPMQAASTEAWQAPSFVSLAYAPTDLAAAEAAAAAGADAALLDLRGLQRFAAAIAARSAAPAAPMRLVAPVPAPLPCPFVSLLVVDAPEALALVLAPGDLTPRLPPAAGGGSDDDGACAASGLAAFGYVAVPWSPGFDALDARCAEGAPALVCAAAFGAGGLRVVTGVAPNQRARGAPHPFELLSLSPVLASGFALLGELGKVTRVSPTRFPAVAASGVPGGAGAAAAALSFLLAGASGEEVDVALLAPPPGGGGGGLDVASVRRLRVAFGAAGGLAQVRCEAAAPAANCTVAGAVILS